MDKYNVILFIFITYGLVSCSSVKSIDTRFVDENAEQIINSSIDLQLINAVKLGDVTGVQAALAAQANENARDQLHGATPLMFAAMRQNVAIVAALLKSGADVTVRDYNKASIMHFAAYGGNNKIVKLLLMYDSLIDEVDIHGITPLMIAAYRGNQDVVRLLLELEVVATKTDDYGANALMLASIAGYEGIIAMLLNEGIDINAVDYNEKSALLLASYSASLNVIKFLMRKGANPNQQDIFGHTPVIEATRGGQTSVLQYLVENGADINKGYMKSQYGEERGIQFITAYGLAVRMKRNDLINYLSSVGARQEVADNVLTNHLNDNKETMS